MRLEQLGQMVGCLVASANPVIAFRARALLLGEPPASAPLVRHRDANRTCQMANRLLSHRQAVLSERRHYALTIPLRRLRQTHRMWSVVGRSRTARRS